MRVLSEMRLHDGTLFPITLPVDARDVHLDRPVVLHDARNNQLAIMHVEEAYPWDAAEEAQAVLGTTDSRHPLVPEMARWGNTYISSPFQAFNLPNTYDFVELRRTPAQVRAALAAMGNRR